MTIDALDYNKIWNDEIDVIVKSIPFHANNDEVKVEETGTNGIGWFNFSYRVQNFDSKNSYECSFDSVTTISVTSVSNDNNTDQPQGKSSDTILPISRTCIANFPVHNSTDLPQVESSSSLWTLIAVAIMLLLTLFVTIIIAIFIVRNMSVKLKETKERNARDSDGRHTYISNVYICVLLASVHKVYIHVFTVQRQIFEYQAHNYRSLRNLKRFAETIFALRGNPTSYRDWGN